jgi:hypothetical protein
MHGPKIGEEESGSGTQLCETRRQLEQANHLIELAAEEQVQTVAHFQQTLEECEMLAKHM